MADETSNLVIPQLLALLRETVEGPVGNSSWFTDNTPGSGLLGTLAPLTATDVSRPLGGSTIAAHVNHVLFGLEVSSAWLRGDRTQRDWKESWRVRTVDEAEWSAMTTKLRVAYDGLRQAMETHALDSGDSLAGAIAALAHVATHLGAIRQKILFAREASA